MLPITKTNEKKLSMVKLVWFKQRNPQIYLSCQQDRAQDKSSRLVLLWKPGQTHSETILLIQFYHAHFVTVYCDLSLNKTFSQCSTKSRKYCCILKISNQIPTSQRYISKQVVYKLLYSMLLVFNRNCSLKTTINHLVLWTIHAQKVWRNGVWPHMIIYYYSHLLLSSSHRFEERHSKMVHQTEFSV